MASLLEWDWLAARHRLSTAYHWTPDTIRRLKMWDYLGYELQLSIQRRDEQEALERWKLNNG
jgi:hypothetical protein